MPDLNAANVEAAMSMIAGTARSMGVEVVRLSIPGGRKIPFITTHKGGERV